MKKIVVIGAGIGQIHLVKQAKRMGLNVTVVSPKGYPAIDYADDLFECDIYEWDKIVDFCRINEIDAVVSDQNDLMVPTVAYVAETLGLPGLSYSQARTYCDKDKFRDLCRKIGVPAPETVAVSDSSFPESFSSPFPWIVKPVDSQSSIGVSVIESPEDYEPLVDKAISKSRNHKAIVEEFFIGDEYVCEGFVYQGKYHNLFFGDRKYFHNSLIPCQTLFPSFLEPKIKEQIISCEERISSAINPPFGIIHSEYLVNHRDGSFIIVESAIRGGGVYISSHLVPLSTGINVNELLIRCSLGEKIDIDGVFRTKKNRASAYVCFTLPEGVIVKTGGLDEVLRIEGVEMTDFRNIELGQYTEEMTVKGQRKGPVIVQASNREQLDKVIERVKETVSIEVEDSQGRISVQRWE